MSARLACLSLAVASSLGCGGAARVLASPAETDAYRRTRASYTIEDRLVAATRYLEAYPTGRFAADVRRRFELEEARFYAQKRGRVDGLDWYLLVLPRGPHAAEASLLRADYKKREEELSRTGQLRAAWSMERRLARAEASRKQAVELVTTFLAGAAASDAWGAPLWQQPKDVLGVLRDAPNPGRCDDLRCARFASVPFAIPVAGGGLDERALVVDVVVSLAAGGVERLTLRGPGLFSRVYEAQQAKAVVGDPESARALAVGFAEELVAGSFEARMPAARCGRPVNPPEILRRACGGAVLRVVVGGDGEDDIVELSGERAKLGWLWSLRLEAVPAVGHANLQWARGGDSCITKYLTCSLPGAEGMVRLLSTVSPPSSASHS